MDAIETRNIDALEAMMCLNIKQNVTDLRSEIDALIDAIDGKVTEYDWKIEGGGYSGSRSGKRIVQDNWGIYFKTPVKNYRLLVYWEVANNFSPGETGIRRIRLVSETDDVLLNLISATEGVNDWHD